MHLLLGMAANTAGGCLSLLCCFPIAGNGRSQKPNPLDSSTWWTVDDHFQKDVPAVLQYVLTHTGAKQLHWIGHSMVSRSVKGSLYALMAASEQSIHRRHLELI